MRETCLFCVSKHISQAIVLTVECCTGYPIHIWIAIGHLAEAETEALSQYPELATQIRKVRLSLMGQEGIFNHNDLIDLLKDTRKIAEVINGISEEERVLKILYPGMDVTIDTRCVDTLVVKGGVTDGTKDY